LDVSQIVIGQSVVTEKPLLIGRQGKQDRALTLGQNNAMSHVS
jgi:hypothetical protein